MTQLRILHSSSILLVAVLSALYSGFVSAFYTPLPLDQRQCRSSTTWSCLHSKKNSDRARAEHMLEKSMGDWRSFRAKLVAQERAEESANGKLKKKNKKDKNQDDKVSTSSDDDDSSEISLEASDTSDTSLCDDEKNSVVDKKSDDEVSRNGQLGDLFGAAISSIFKKKDTTSSSSSKSTTASTSTISSSAPAKSSIRTLDTHEMPALEELVDPFASAEELPIHLKPKNWAFDSHRWAHPMDHIEPGCVFLSNERLGGVFHQSVILVVDHHPTTGTTGIVINRPLDGNLQSIASQEETKLDLSLKIAFSESPVGYGGPVMMDEFAVLHGYGEVEGSKKLAPGIFIGGSDELMDQVRLDHMDATQALFVKGHAAWVPGQLDKELSKGVWYTAAASPDLILRYAGAPVTKDDNPKDLWSDILTCMGGHFADIARQYSDRGDRRLMP